MNKTLEIIKKHQLDINALKTLLKDQEYLNGLEVKIYPFGNEDKTVSFTLGLFSQSEKKCLDFFIEALERSQKSWINILTQEIQEVEEFLKELK